MNLQYTQAAVCVHLTDFQSDYIYQKNSLKKKQCH